MFHRILAPVDLSDRNETALAAAGDLALASGGEVHLLHVVETIEDVPFGELDDFYRRLEERADEALDRLAGGLRDGGVAVGRRVVFGKRAGEIVRFAEEWEADLIVLTSHRLDPERPGAGWATISYRVALLAQCPVLLVK